MLIVLLLLYSKQVNDSKQVSLSALNFISAGLFSSAACSASWVSAVSPPSAAAYSDTSAAPREGHVRDTPW